MPTPFLYMRNRSSSHAQCAVFKDSDRQLVQIGNDFGTTETDITTAPSNRCGNRAIHWGNDILAINGDTIWKYDTLTQGSGGTGDWEIFHQFSSYNGSAQTLYNAGLIPCSISGSGLLLTSYPHSAGAGQSAYVRIYGDGTVEEMPAISYGGGGDHDNQITSNGMWLSARHYQEQLIYGNRSFIGRQYVYDIATNTHFTRSPKSYGGSAIPGRSQIAIMRNKAFSIDQTGTSTAGEGGDQTGSDVGIWKWDIGPSFDDQVRQVRPDCEVTGGQNHSTDQDGSYAQIEINGKIYLFGANGGNTTYQLWEIDLDQGEPFDLVSSVDISSLLPAAITSINPASHWKALWRVDTITNGPENPIYEIEFTDGANTARRVFSWDTAPTGSGWTSKGSAMTGREFAWIDAVDSGPYSLAAINVSQPRLTVKNIAVSAEYEIFGPSALAGSISLELYFDKNGELTQTKGTILSTDKGTLNGNTVEGLSPGDIVTVRWDAVGDGVLSTDRVKVNGRVFV